LTDHETFFTKHHVKIVAPSAGAAAHRTAMNIYIYIYMNVIEIRPTHNRTGNEQEIDLPVVWAGCTERPGNESSTMVRWQSRH